MTHTYIRRLLLWEIFLIGVLIGCGITLFATKAFACDPGSWYQPDHQVCAPYPPPYSPGYQQPPSDTPWPPNLPRWNR